MALNTGEMWSNGIKIAFFQKIAKNRPAPPDPRLWYGSITVHFFA